MAVMGDEENERLISALLKHPRIGINVQDANGWTPLHHACQRGFSRAVSALQCADFCCVNSDGDSPLHLAVSKQHTNIFEELEKSEAFRTRYANDPIFTEVKVMHNVKLSQGYHFLFQDSDGNTLLHTAIDVGNSSVIEWCLSFGFKICSCNHRKMNCLHIAAKRDYKIAARIMEQAQRELKNEDLTSFVNSLSHDRYTPIYIAAKFGNPKTMELLLEK